MKELAIIGPTASGKSSLAIKLAKKYDANILSIDSLSIYKEIDIVSAKPSHEELNSIKHYGINLVYPNHHFNVERFINVYKRAKEESKNKNLIIVGGTIFYLKALLDGLSPMPKISQETQKKVKEILKYPIKAYEYLKKIDPTLSKKITNLDRYRIQKALEIFFETNMPPTEYFNLNPPKPIIEDIPIFSIEITKEELIKNLKIRTKKMIESGLIEEIYYLEKKYGRAINPMKAIGIIETLDYLDGKINIKKLEESIIKNSAKLAKRQKTFIKTQIKKKESIKLEDIRKVEIFMQKQA
jgi:tRNA dimethylallyltransferase